jgi:hypothetical protein
VKPVPIKKEKKGKKVRQTSRKRRFSELAAADASDAANTEEPEDLPSPSVLFGFLDDASESIAHRTRRRHDEERE